ncbi:Ribose 5-phosphate isomerase A [Liberibacter crescens BT-1]|uniref:Ribose-5-phosphate isomerase A n=2 Tax=Liberibacter crescens TaxID=1273132 RepID=L0EWH5_LIBCB|nr:Ribose 5-phosphate isomerase A [Liberibacter crescens BT-1]
MKVEAARMALEYVVDDIVLGIGTGSTVEEFIHLLGEKVSRGLRIKGVATSKRTESLCHHLRIPLVSMDDIYCIDLTIDGVDEVDSELRLIKGRGGALLREKIVASVSKKMIVIADESKVVDFLGKVPLPIEIDPFGVKATSFLISDVFLRLGLHGHLKLRNNGDHVFITDGGHYIVDAFLNCIPDVELLSNELHAIPGVIDHGLFIGMTQLAIIGKASGGLLMEPH